MKSKIFALILIVSLAAASCGNRNTQKTSSDGTAASEATAETTENTKTMDSNLAFDPASLPEEPIFEIHTQRAPSPSCSTPTLPFTGTTS